MTIESSSSSLLGDLGSRGGAGGAGGGEVFGGGDGGDGRVVGLCAASRLGVAGTPRLVGSAYIVSLTINRVESL